MHVKDFARELYKELKTENWGDIDPYLFDDIANEGDPDYAALSHDAQSLRDAIIRVLCRI